jgi:hypothetical protein
MITIQSRKVVLSTLILFTPLGWAQSVDFLQPKNGDILSSPFKVAFTVSGMSVAPAGTMTENTGHHHLLINTGAMASGATIPADATHLHFGKGQTETEVTLPPGHYQLTMQFANGAHQSFGETMSKTIEITVK